MSEPMERTRLNNPSQRVSQGGLIEIRGPDIDGNDTVKHIRTFTCCHCGNIHHIAEDAAEMGFCGRCHARECIGCAKRLNGMCEPFLKQIEAQEQRARLLAAIGV